MADKPVEMVTVDGVRYRPEDAPKRFEEKSAPAPKNKARKPADKAAGGVDKEG